MIWDGRAEACQLAPSRGSPAPVHGSGPPDRPDRKPSRTACSSENNNENNSVNEDSKLGLMCRANLRSAERQSLFTVCGITC